MRRTETDILKIMSLRVLSRSILPTLVMAVCARSAAWGSPAAIEAPVIHVLTDIHYLAESLHDDGSAFRKLVYEGDGKNTELINEILQAYRFSLQKEKPDIILVTGDLTLNGERASHLALASWFKEIESLGVKVFVLPGNHDILNPWARGYSKSHTYTTESITPEKFNSVYGAFGFNEAISRDGNSLSYIVAPIPGLRIFMLDSNIYADNIRWGHPEAGGEFSDTTLEWIKLNMEKAKRAGARVLVAMHHNIVDHNSFISEKYTISDAESVLDRFSEAGINFVFTGHVHVQDISKKTTSRGNFHDIATNALSVFPHQYGRVSFDPENRLLRYRTVPVDVESWAREKRINDDPLVGFRTYSESFFRDRSALMIDRMLGNGDSQLAGEHAVAMIALFGTLNARFFAGNAFLNASDTALSEIYKDLVTVDYGLLSLYAQSIIEDPSPENNQIEISF